MQQKHKTKNKPKSSLNPQARKLLRHKEKINLKNKN